MTSTDIDDRARRLRRWRDKPHGFSHRRQIGPIGTASRVVGGLIATGVPIALEGLTWWDAAALIAFPFIATAAAALITAGYARSAPDALTRRHAICSGPACTLTAVLIAAAFGIGATTPAQGDVVLWAFLGISMLLAAARGYGGCELLAFPNAITGRSDEIGCLIYTPIDRAEARRRARLAAPARGRRPPSTRPATAHRAPGDIIEP